MTVTSTTTLADQISVLIAEEALSSGVVRPVVSQFFNQYKLDPSDNGTFRLLRYADTGIATAKTEGVEFTDEDEHALDTTVNMTPTSAAVKLGRITDEAIQRTTGLLDARALIESGNIEQALRIFAPQAQEQVKRCVEKLESDSIALFSGLSQSVGSVSPAAADLDLGVFEEAIYTLEISDAESQNYVACLHPRQASDLRRAMAVTSGGLTGSVHMGKSVDHLEDPNGFAFNLLGVDVFRYSKDVEITDGYNVTGAMFIPGVGQPERGLGGVAGTFAVCHAKPLSIGLEHKLRVGATDIMAQMHYAVAERVDSWGVKIVSDE